MSQERSWNRLGLSQAFLVLFEVVRMLTSEIEYCSKKLWRIEWKKPLYGALEGR